MNQIIKRTFIILFLLPVASLLFGQQVTDLRINEIYLNRDVENLVDDYGRHVPWVEIFNTSFNTVNIAECYLTNDTTGLASGIPSKKWYRIPKGDPGMRIPQQGFVIFYLDADPTYGPFHTNFDPYCDYSSNYVALISVNGRTLIDLFEFPPSLRTDSCSYGYRVNYGPEKINIGGETVSNLTFLNHFTPGSTNDYEVGDTKSEFMKKQDPYGIALTIIAMSVVFSALFVIFLLLKLFAKTTNINFQFGKKRAQKVIEGTTPIKGEATKTKVPKLDSSEELAVIAMALRLHLTTFHDVESEIITIDTSSAHYSPWSQKHLLLRRNPRKN